MLNLRLGQLGHQESIPALEDGRETYRLNLYNIASTTVRGTVLHTRFESD